MRPLPKRLVTTAERGRRNEVVHIGGESWALRPISLAVAFSLSILSCVSASSGRVKRGDTDNARRDDRRADGFGFGKVMEARALSTSPEARSITTIAATSPVASTETGPIARHVFVPDFTKCSGSPDISPLIRIAVSVALESSSVRRTIAPGAGADGDMRSVCACADKAVSATAARILITIIPN
jgi:hypothetical protein